MGKKHKKHKSEHKHGYEEYGERPLKLVLKVAGNEVTAGSSSHDTFYEDSNSRPAADPEKPKEKKKKKKKDKERTLGSPADDKGKKKMGKKKKGQDGDWEEREQQNRTPIRSELDKQEEKDQSPLQEALNQLIRQLQRKDPNAFFYFPVTDLIAPGYSSVIKRPMDFSTMRDKVRKDIYQSLDELKEDFRVMCENAMRYNKADTIYHKAARKLLHSGMKILSPERLESLRQSIDFMSGLDPSGKPGKLEEEGGASGRDPMVTDASESSQSPTVLTPRQDKDSKEEALKAERELQEIRKLIGESGGKLSNRVLQCELEFVRRKNDGSTTLGILNPVDLTIGDVGYCPVRLGMMTNRLQSGVNCLQGFREDKRNRTTPVAYMSYGPFTSYAPTYDSSFANISKEESDLVYSSYGEESSLRGSESISEFLTKSEEYTYQLADNLLDALTNGEHSKSLKQTEPTSQQAEEPKKTQQDRDDMEVVEAAAANSSRLDTLYGLFSNVFTDEHLSGEALHFQKKLDDTTKLLRELQEAQRERLSAKPPPNMICLLAPTAKELQLAEKVTGNLAQLTSQVAPCDVSSVWGIRKAMGISLPPEPSQPLIDLTTVQELADPMDTMCAQEGTTLIAV